MSFILFIFISSFGLSNQINNIPQNIETLSKMSGLYGSPSEAPSIEIARIGNDIVGDFLIALEVIYLALKAQDMMTLGVEDFIAGLANTHEGYAYLLGQRVKNNLD